MKQLLEFFRPKNYQLDLKIDKEKQTLKGKVVVRGTAKTADVRMHAVGLTIEKVKVGDTAAEFVMDGDELVIKNVPVEDVAITINYHGKLGENMQGAYLSSYEYKGHTEKIVSTQFESHYARMAFPCIDEPAAKATFDLSITLPEDSDDLVIANTPIARRDGDTVVFETTPRMSTYLLAFVIGKFNSKTIKNNHGTVITTYAALNQSADSVNFANEVAARSLEYYDNQFGVPYPLEKLDQVAIPDFEAGAMENWGLVTYRESMLLADKTVTLDTKKSIALTVAHELSHQWFTSTSGGTSGTLGSIESQKGKSLNWFTSTLPRSHPLSDRKGRRLHVVKSICSDLSAIAILYHLYACPCHVDALYMSSNAFAATISMAGMDFPAQDPSLTL